MRLADVGAEIAVEVTPVSQNGDSSGTPFTSAAVGPIPLPKSTPTLKKVWISGIPQVGKLLTGHHDGDKNGKYKYRWLIDTFEIQGAIDTTYVPVDRYRGDQITFEVTPISHRGLEGKQVTSKPTGPIKPSVPRL